MAESEELGTRAWVRFDRYQEKEGYICPAPGAQLQTFDQLPHYAGVRSATGAQEPPYGSFLNLVQSVRLEPRPGPGRLQTLSADSAKLVTSWCAGHGLMGLLPQRAQMITLAPRYGPLKDVPDRCVPWLTQYIRTNRGWDILTRWGVRQQTVGIGSEGALVPAEQVPKGWPDPGALIQHQVSSQWSMEKLSDVAKRYFPGVPLLERDTYFYPCPLTEEFWRLYAEPVDEFVEAAAHLLGIVRDLGNPSDTADNKAKRKSAVDRLNNILGAAAPVAGLSDSGEIVKLWHTPSLLSTFAMMIREDLSEQRWPRTCDNCGKVFVTKAYQGRYCTDKCRFAAQKRRYRQRQKRQIGLNR